MIAAGETSRKHFLERNNAINLQSVIMPAVETRALQEAGVLIVQGPGAGAASQTPRMPSPPADTQYRTLAHSFPATAAFHDPRRHRRLRADDVCGILVGEFRRWALAGRVLARVLRFRLRTGPSLNYGTCPLQKGTMGK